MISSKGFDVFRMSMNIGIKKQKRNALVCSLLTCDGPVVRVVCVCVPRLVIFCVNSFAVTPCLCDPGLFQRKRRPDVWHENPRNGVF